MTMGGSFWYLERTFSCLDSVFLTYETPHILLTLQWLCFFLIKCVFERSLLLELSAIEN